MIDLPVLSIPSPPVSSFNIFGFQLRMYAVCIIIGIVVGYLIANRRWQERGGRPDSMELVVAAAVPFGIVGARLYHVITDYQLYFGPGRDPLDALKIWQGGLGIWGGVALGALGAYLVARKRKIKFAALADAVAPGIIVAQAIGRLGNWFNQELFGGPTTLPWGLIIDPAHRPAGYEQFETFHPTFLYELLWNLGVFVVLILIDRRFKLGHGTVVALYTMGRFWVEALRIDPVNEVGGFRLNNYTSLIVFVAAVIWLVLLFKFRPGREVIVEGGPDDQPGAAVADDQSAAAAEADSEPAEPGEAEPGEAEPVATESSEELESDVKAESAAGGAGHRSDEK
jgi:prolipoprotein diacylglyceryl transferase